MEGRGFWQRSFEENREMLGIYGPLLMVLSAVVLLFGGWLAERAGMR